MEITKEMYEKIAHLFPKQKSPPKISNLELLNAILKVMFGFDMYQSASRFARSFKKKWANKQSERLKVDSTKKYI